MRSLLAAWPSGAGDLPLDLGVAGAPTRAFPKAFPRGEADADKHRGGGDGVEALRAELCVFLVCAVTSVGGMAFWFKPAFFGALSERQRSGAWASPSLSPSRCAQPCRGWVGEELC